MARTFLSTLSLSAVVLVSLAGFANANGMGKSTAITAATVKSIVVPAAAITATKLGDLTPFRQIASDTLAIAEKGDLAAAEKRATDLETMWDDNAHAMRKMDKQQWTALDNALDATFEQLRADKPDAKGCVDALTTLVKLMDATA